MKLSALLKRVRSLRTKGRLADAAGMLEQVYRCSAHPALRFELAEIWLELGRAADCRRILLDSVGSGVATNDMRIMLASACLMLGNLSEAEQHIKQALQADNNAWRAFYILGDIYREQGSFDAAEQCYGKALQLNSGHAQTAYLLGNMLKSQGRTDGARACYDMALQLDPKFADAFWQRERLLPVVYDDEGHIHASRERYRQGLDELQASLNLDTRDHRLQALRGLLSGANFYLQYQGLDDRELQCKYGAMLQEVMRRCYPQWSKSLQLRSLRTGDKIRVGYCSAFLRDHNGANWVLGWLKQRDQNDFKVYAYHTGSKTDEITGEFRECCDVFHHIPANLDRVCEQIYSDAPDVLVYPELGMDAQSMMMAGLRLAPVQCVGWGHPVTSGLTTMDYWISSDLMEPADGQRHYLEKLVRLPNMANCYSTRQRDYLAALPIRKSRADFGLPEDAVLYFCSQSLFKYLPQYDFLWPEIAQRVPGARFVFLAISSVHLVKRFMARIERAFSDYGLRAADYCVMLNRQTPEDYLQLNLLMDVFLDNPPWSGNNTALASIDCGVPIVSWPTGLMRGRHSYAILSMMGMQDEIARDAQQYIDIAAQLGTNPQRLQDVRRELLSRRELIYEDVSVVQELENFYRTAVGWHAADAG